MLLSEQTCPARGSAFAALQAVFYPDITVFTAISALLKRVYFNNMVSELQRQLLTVGPRWGPGPGALPLGPSCPEPHGSAHAAQKQPSAPSSTSSFHAQPSLPIQRSHSRTHRARTAQTWVSPASWGSFRKSALVDTVCSHFSVRARSPSAVSTKRSDAAALRAQ